VHQPACDRHWGKWGSSGSPVTRQALRWNGWYLIRLPIGAAFGTVAALIVVLLLGSVGGTADGGVDVSPVGGATLFVIAFIVGYHQDIFRRLVERVVEVLLGPGTATPDDEGFSTQATLDFDFVPLNGRAERDLHLTNKRPKVVEHHGVLRLRRRGGLRRRPGAGQAAGWRHRRHHGRVRTGGSPGVLGHAHGSGGRWDDPDRGPVGNR
jgi:hypothetical protein